MPPAKSSPALYVYCAALQADARPLWVCKGAYTAAGRGCATRGGDLPRAGLKLGVGAGGPRVGLCPGRRYRRAAAVAPARPPGGAAGEAGGSAAGSSVQEAQRCQRGVGRWEPRGGRVVHTSSGGRSEARCPCGSPRGLGGARCDHAPRGSRTSGMGGTPGVPAVSDGLPR